MRSSTTSPPSARVTTHYGDPPDHHDATALHTALAAQPTLLVEMMCP
ncbi:MAG: hypothetical protein ACRD0K_29935 [Egibacteraceae bacterium]